MDGWGVRFSRNSHVRFVVFFFREASVSGWRGARTSRGSCLSGWLGRVYLEKLDCLDGCGAYPRERLVWMAVPALLRSRISVWSVSLLALDYSYYVQLVWMGHFQDSPPPGRIVFENNVVSGFIRSSISTIDSTSSSIVIGSTSYNPCDRYHHQYHRHSHLASLSSSSSSA